MPFKARNSRSETYNDDPSTALGGHQGAKAETSVLPKPRSFLLISVRNVRIWAYARTLSYYLFSNALCLLLIGYGKIQFRKILNLGGDTTQVLNFAKSYIDGYGFRFNPRLGYPGVMDNMYWPTFDFTGRFLLWIFGRITSSAELSYHLLYLAGLCLMTSGMLFGCVRLRVRPWLALVAACAFIATPFFASRALGHDFLSLYYGAAFGGTLCLQVASLDREETVATFFKRPGTWICIWFAATSGLYYAFFTCLFTGLGGLMNASWRRRSPPLAIMAAIIAIIGPLMVLTGFGSGVVDVLSGKIPQVIRGSFEQLGLGLNPAEAVNSLAAVPGLGWTLDSYKVVLPSILGVKGLYEWPSAILCLVIFSAPVIAAVLSREDPSSRSRHWIQLIQISASFITFGVLYAIRGGVAYYFNLLISSNIRGTDRIMPFLMFFAIVVLCGLIEIALSLRRRWLGWPIAVVITAALGFGIWPYAGALSSKQAMVLSNTDRMASIASTRRMLLAKDAAGITTVLQLPHVVWPEQPPVRTFDPYAHQNAYILDRAGATTRWSYGSAAPQAAFKTVQQLVADHTTSGLDQAARELGFDAILIEKAAYDAAELGILRSNIDGEDLKGGCRVFDDDYRTLYALNAGRKNCLK